MARRLRFCPQGVALHLIQRGNNQSACFREEADYAFYAYWLNEAAVRNRVQIHAWVFMTNHTHLLVTPTNAGGTSRMMQQLGSRYVGYFNRTYGRTGTLWEGRFRACLVESEIYLMRCYRYIELNPVRAGMVTEPALYKWSSHHCNGYGVETKLCTPHQQYLSLGFSPRERQENYRSLFLDNLNEAIIDEIRMSINSGKMLGSERFKEIGGQSML